MHVIEILIRCIGFCHLLQPPLTLLLARRLQLLPAFEALPRVALLIVKNLGAAAIVLPTSLGLFVSANAGDAMQLGKTYFLAVGLSAFWCLRLAFQLFVLGREMRKTSVAWNRILLIIFWVEGPGLMALLIALRWGAFS